MIYAKLTLKEGSSYQEMMENDVATGGVSPLVIGIAVGVLFLIIVIVLLVMYLKNRSAQKSYDRRYDVKKHTDDYQRDMEMESAARENQVVNDDEKGGEPMGAYKQPTTNSNAHLHVETESLMKTAPSVDHESYKYEPNSSCELTSR